MTIANLGSVSAAQPNWQARKADRPDLAVPGQKTGTHQHARSGATGQPSLSDTLQSLLLGTQSSQGTATPGTIQGATQGATTSVLQQLQQTLTKAMAAYGSA